MKHLLNAATGNVTIGTTIIQPRRVRDEKGIWQVSITTGATGAATISIYGRAAPDAPWHLVLASTATAVTAATNDTDATLIDLFPEMTVAVTGHSAGATYNGWLVD